MPIPEISTEGAGLVVALPAEAHSLGVRGLGVGDCARWQHGWVAVSGIGPDNAARAAGRLLARGVERLANWGVAGALDASLSPGDVVIPERVRHADGGPGFTTDDEAAERLVAALSAHLPIHRGTLWSARHPIASATDKCALAEWSGAVAVDMEAAAIAAVAVRAGLPFIAVKAICDPVTRELPGTIVRAMGEAAGDRSLRMLMAIAFGGPASWRAARWLARDFAQARRALATAAALAT
jgi:nucleoside phosphorylase